MDQDTTPERPARPLRRRGVARLNLILDATESLLAENGAGDISLADIAAAAGVPLPSVYHFFPNRNAAFVALALRFNEEIYRRSIEVLADPEPQTWQELIDRKHCRAAEFQNGRPAALRLFLGAGVSVAVRKADLTGNARIAVSRARMFEAYFRMPVIPDFVAHLEIAAAAMDGVWSLSYGRHGLVTEAYRREATAATIAYLRRILPEILPRRPLDPAMLARIAVSPEEVSQVLQEGGA
ncbi:transcriptional regulator, TetR family [Methylobacterium sp. 174MFSha1.1]|uniref:TetR/AcrR family transcriptional regulator n=1 Tax=Methylobacterium sp. 174MFSha1.1 TaxID=1502749 RepID=UPI0008EA0DD4|nr:TetR/AcrR family transcriptional regulator [Methylobacterium sp. 174MFSha1.1]SFU49973.1 transcriptional regulator, TetR family [Methylobacterium sp. 174MFSha1.1]